MYIATAKTPKNRATISAGCRNCQTDTPEARTITSSELRLSSRNAPIEPISTAKGRISSAKEGRRSRVRSNTCPAETSTFAASRIISTKSMKNTSTRQMP